jgi:predicted Zn-dependent peptidase
MNSGPPQPDPTPQVFFPTPAQCSLQNGLKVVCVEDPHLPKVSIRFALPVGRVHDPVELQGLAQMVVEMLKEGTDTRSSQDISSTIDRLAIDYDSDVAMEHTVVSFALLEQHLEPGLELLADLVRNPSFPEVEFEKVRARWHGSLLSQRSDPAFLANERLFKEIFRSHPYANVSIPLEHLEGFACGDLADFFRNHFQPRGSYLMLAGAIGQDDAVALAKRYFGDWEGKELVRSQFPAVPELDSHRVVLVDRPHSVQTKILMGTRTVAQSDPAFLQLKLANQVLGGGGSARLFLNLREDKGYTYGAYSFLKQYKRDGLLLLSANVRSDVSGESVGEFFNELKRMRQTVATAEEVARSKAELVGSFLRQLETPTSIGSLEVVRLLMELPADYYSSYISSIQKFTPEDIRGIARQILDPDSVLTVLVGDRSQLEEQVADFEEITVYDIHGTRMQ